MALPSTCVAPCSVLPSLGVGVGGAPMASGSSAVAEVRSRRPGERAGPDRQLALHSQRRRWFSVHAKQTGEAARSPTSLSGPTGTAAATARMATTRTRTLGQQDVAGVPGGEAQPAAGCEPLLTPGILVSALPELRCAAEPNAAGAFPGTEGRDQGALSAGAPTPAFLLLVEPLKAGGMISACAWARAAGGNLTEVGRVPGPWWLGRISLQLKAR